MAAAWFASFSIGWCFFHLFWVSLHPLFSHMGRARFGEWALTGPAGPDHDRGLRPRGVDEAVVVDQGRVVRDAIHVKRDRGELQVEGVMVPLIITDLRQTAEHGISKGGRRRRDTGRRKTLPHLLKLPEEFHRPCAFQQWPVEERNPAAMHSQRVVRVAILCQEQAQGVTCHTPSSPSSQNPEAHAAMHDWHSAPCAHRRLERSQKKGHLKKLCS